MKKKTVSKKTYYILIFFIYFISFLIIENLQQKYKFPIWIAVLALTGLGGILSEIAKIVFEVNGHEDKKRY